MNSTRRQVVTLLVIFAVCVATAWVWAWPSKADTPQQSSSVEVLADGTGCVSWIAGWVSVPVECNRAPLPPIVRKCAGSAFVGGLLAWLSGGVSIAAGAGSGLMGCIPWANE